MNATNKTLSIIAFYLSEYDMDAVSALASKLVLKQSTLSLPT